MITSMHIENFKCFKEFDIELGPFNVLIGPNDTGKTAFLQAISLAGVSVPGPKSLSDISNLTGFDMSEAFWQAEMQNSISLCLRGKWQDRETDDVKMVINYHVDERSAPEVAVVTIEPSEKPEKPTIAGIFGFPSGNVPTKAVARFADWLRNTAYYSFDPRHLRKPCLHAASLSEIGEGLPALLESILRADRERFLALEKHFYRRFPSYSRLELPLAKIQREADGIGLSFQTRQGKLLTADSVSDGVMLSLAFLAITYQLSPPRVLLIEEPETGVHHASLKDIVETLKQLSKDKGVQVIMTTHSPYMLDGVDPGVVHVFQKDEEGAVHAKKLSDFEGAGEISDMFSTGEKWSLLAEKYGI